MKPLFDMVSEMNELEELEHCFQRGEELFAPEHERYEEISEKLKAQGYTVEQVEEFKQHYKNEIARVRDKEKAVSKEERIAKRILAELMKPDTEKTLEETREKEENRKVEKSRQPVL